MMSRRSAEATCCPSETCRWISDDGSGSSARLIIQSVNHTGFGILTYVNTKSPLFTDAVAALEEGAYISVNDELSRTVPDGCFLDIMDFRLEFVGRHRAKASMVIQDKHLNQAGVCQGGLIVALADAAAGWAAKTALTPPLSFVTLTMSTNVLRSARPGDILWAEAIARHVGRSTMVFEVTVRRGDGAADPIVATSTMTQMVLS
ncbi:UNVERIFIED_ORG: uncharacterized protein (TIGR00369 family) [Gordonia westfalica J30]